MATLRTFLATLTDRLLYRPTLFAVAILSDV